MTLLNISLKMIGVFFVVFFFSKLTIAQSAKDEGSSFGSSVKQYRLQEIEKLNTRILELEQSLIKSKSMNSPDELVELKQRISSYESSDLARKALFKKFGIQEEDLYSQLVAQQMNVVYINDLEIRLESISKDLEFAEHHLQIVSSSELGLEAKVAAQSMAIEEMQSEIIDRSQKLNEITEEVVKLTVNNSALRERILNTNELLAESRRAYAQKSIRFDELETSFNQQIAIVNEAREKISLLVDSKKDAEHANAQFATLKNDVEIKEQQIQLAEGAVKKIQEQLSDKAIELNHMVAQLSEKNEMLDALNERNTLLLTDNSDLNKKLARAISEKDEANREFSQVEQKLTSLVQDHENLQSAMLDIERKHVAEKETSNKTEARLEASGELVNELKLDLKDLRRRLAEKKEKDDYQTNFLDSLQAELTLALVERDELISEQIVIRAKADRDSQLLTKLKKNILELEEANVSLREQMSVVESPRMDSTKPNNDEYSLNPSADETPGGLFMGRSYHILDGDRWAVSFDTNGELYNYLSMVEAKFIMRDLPSTDVCRKLSSGFNSDEDLILKLQANGFSVNLFWVVSDKNNLELCQLLKVGNTFKANLIRQRPSRVDRAVALVKY